MKKEKWLGLPFIEIFTDNENKDFLLFSPKKLIKKFLKQYRESAFDIYNELYAYFINCLGEVGITFDDIHLFVNQQYEARPYGGELEHLPYKLKKDKKTGEITLGDYLTIFCLEKRDNSNKVYVEEISQILYRYNETDLAKNKNHTEWFFTRKKEEKWERVYWEKVIKENIKEISTWDI